MDDASTPRRLEDGARPVNSHPDRRGDYEPPTIAVIGPLTKITLGSGGNMNDGLNKLKKS
jgi:hypothetical protein